MSQEISLQDSYKLIQDINNIICCECKTNLSLYKFKDKWYCWKDWKSVMLGTKNVTRE